MQFCVDRAVSGQKSQQCTIARRTVPLHGTIKLTSPAFNGLSILYHVIQSNDKNLHWCYILNYVCMNNMYQSFKQY